MLSTNADVEVAFGSNVIVALFSIRLTVASCTPVCSASVRWMKDWHAAQVIPLTGMVTRSAGTKGRPALSTAASSVFKVVAMICLRDDCLLLNARGEADAVDGGGNLLSSCLFGIARQICRTDLHVPHLNSGDGLQCSAYSAHTGCAMHSFNR